MSKQSKAKAAQFFHTEPACCCECKHCQETRHPKSNGHYEWETRSLKCGLPGNGLGGFAVKPMNTCGAFTRKG